MGLREMRATTRNEEWGLEVTMTDWDDKKYLALYKLFKVCGVFT